jgi:hypothetical protein
MNMSKPLRKWLLVSMLSVLGSAGAMAAEQSHFENFITRDGAQLKDGNNVFRFAGIHAPELHRIEDDARGFAKPIHAVGGNTSNGQPQKNRKTGSARWCKPAPKRSVSMCSRFSRKTM